jgi:hypothetical protein
MVLHETIINASIISKAFLLFTGAWLMTNSKIIESNAILKSYFVIKLSNLKNKAILSILK